MTSAGDGPCPVVEIIDVGVGVGGDVFGRQRVQSGGPVLERLLDFALGEFDAPVVAWVVRQAVGRDRPLRGEARGDFRAVVSACCERSAETPT